MSGRKEEKIRIAPGKKEAGGVKKRGRKTCRGRKIEVIRKLILGERINVQALRRLHFCSPALFFTHPLRR